MGTVRPLRPRPEIGRVLWRAAILLGIGDDDTVDTVAESEHFSARAARVWIEQRLPHAQLPDWVAHRPHGEAGAYLFGQIERGMYTIQGEHGIAWEPDPDAPLWDALPGSRCGALARMVTGAPCRGRDNAPEAQIARRLAARSGRCGQVSGQGA